MDEATRALVAVSAALASGDRGALGEALDRAAEVADPLAVEEVLIQSYLFLGYPAALNALALWRETSGLPAPPPTVEDREGWRRRGEAVCARVYGGQYERLRGNVARLHPDMERWMLEEGYGKVLGRPGVELRVRELCIVALLAGQGAEPQLYAHLRGALNAGASPEEVEEAVGLACASLDPARAESARRTWAEVRRRREERTGGSTTEGVRGGHVR